MGLAVKGPGLGHLACARQRCAGMASGTNRTSPASRCRFALLAVYPLCPWYINRCLRVISQLKGNFQTSAHYTTPKHCQLVCVAPNIHASCARACQSACLTTELFSPAQVRLWHPLFKPCWVRLLIIFGPPLSHSARPSPVFPCCGNVVTYDGI